MGGIITGIGGGGGGVLITSVSPAGGHTGGKTLVEIDGTGFAVFADPSPDATGRTAPNPPSVRVLFGTVPARAVFVISGTLVQAIAPPQSPTMDAHGRRSLPTVVDVTVTNLDTSGNPVSGQTYTLPQAYSYQLPDLTTGESDLARLVRTFIRLMRDQITPNVSWPKSTDYDLNTGDLLSVTDVPQLPGLVISDLSVRTNDFYARRDPVWVDNGDGTFTEKAPPDTVDLVFSMVGVSNNPVELLNLHAVFRRFLRKNPRVAMPRDPLNLGLGTVAYELNWSEGREAKVTLTANEDNLTHFVYDVSIVGFDVEDMIGLPLGGPGDTGRPHEATVGVSSEAEYVTLRPTIALPKGGQ